MSQHAKPCSHWHKGNMCYLPTLLYVLTDTFGEQPACPGHVAAVQSALITLTGEPSPIYQWRPVTITKVLPQLIPLVDAVALDQADDVVPS